MVTSADVLLWLGDNSGNTDVATQVARCLDTVIASVEQRCSLPAIYPEDVNQAIVMAASRLYKRKSTTEGIMSFDGMGAIRVGSFDADVENLLAPYLQFNFA